MATSILGGLNQEATQEELLSQATLYLAAILRNMPRLDTNYRMTVRVEAQDAGNITSLGGRPADAIVANMSNAGAINIYNNIIVS